eukprot:3933830-Rhodomonas_salina.3
MSDCTTITSSSMVPSTDMPARVSVSSISRPVPHAPRWLRCDGVCAAKRARTHASTRRRHAAADATSENPTRRASKLGAERADALTYASARGLQRDERARKLHSRRHIPLYLPPDYRNMRSR